MIDLIGLLGIRLHLLIGKGVPRPAPYEVLEALNSVKVTNNDRTRDGFQLDFAIGKGSSLDYSLLASDLFDDDSRVIITVIFGAQPHVLIDGLVTNLQLVPSNEPSRSTLRVIGEDRSLALSLEDQNQTYPNQKDSTIVSEILSKAGFRPDVTETDDTPDESERVPSQQCNNLRFVRNLAQRNGFVFYVEPTDVPGITTAYWGPEQRNLPPQPPLTMNMGPETNVDRSINFQYDGLGPAEPEITIIDPFTKQPIKVPLPTSLVPSLSSTPARPLRKPIARDTANKSFALALQSAARGSQESSSAAQAQGEVDAARYGRVLRARRPVSVRGAGKSYDGVYYVEKVEHNIVRYPKPEYKMSFVLKREGRGATGPIVPTAFG